MMDDSIEIKTPQDHSGTEEDIRLRDERVLGTYQSVVTNMSHYEEAHKLPQGLRTGTIGLFQAPGREKKALEKIESKLVDYDGRLTRLRESENTGEIPKEGFVYRRDMARIIREYNLNLTALALTYQELGEPLDVYEFNNSAGVVEDYITTGGLNTIKVPGRAYNPKLNGPPNGPPKEKQPTKGWDSF